MILDIAPNANSWWMTHIICSPELQPLYNSEISMNIGKRYYTSHGKSMHATFLLRLISSRKNSWTRLNDLPVKACLIFAWTNKMVRFMIPKLWIMSLTIQFWLRERDPCELQAATIIMSSKNLRPFFEPMIEPMIY